MEKSLTVNHGEQQVEEWIPLQNGCICCSVKDSGVAALESLIERQKNFDYILLETTGVADPGNVAPMFWQDEGVGSSIYLDGIVTVVDAKNILTSLDEPSTEELPQGEEEHGRAHGSPLMSTAHLQISHADIILLNKTDLVSSADLEAVHQRLRSINAVVKIIPTHHSTVECLSGTILDLRAYSSFDAATSSPSATQPDFASKGHSHLDPTLSTLDMTFPILSSDDFSILERCLEDVLWPTEQEKPYEVHRTKGLLRLKDGSAKMLQGVRDIFDITDAQSIPEDDNSDQQQEQKYSRVVLIGRHLNEIPPNLGWKPSP